MNGNQSDPEAGSKKLLLNGFKGKSEQAEMLAPHSDGLGNYNSGNLASYASSTASGTMTDNIIRPTPEWVTKYYECCEILNLIKSDSNLNSECFKAPLRGKNKNKIQRNR